jgi:hypothetical protein
MRKIFSYDELKNIIDIISALHIQAEVKLSLKFRFENRSVRPNFERVRSQLERRLGGLINKIQGIKIYGCML